jgi:hypothetical protein
MPFTFNGIGTTFYGRRDFALDGTYTTTEWFAFLYVPIIPLRSLRIREVDSGKYFFVYSSQKYAVFSKSRPNLKQVLSVYGWFAALVSCTLLGRVPVIGESPFLPLSVVLVIGLLPWILRRRARRRLLTQVQAGFPNFQPCPGSTANSSSFQSPPGPEAWTSNFKPGSNSEIRFPREVMESLYSLSQVPPSEEYKVLRRARDEGWDSERTQQEMAKVVAQGKPKSS